VMKYFLSSRKRPVDTPNVVGTVQANKLGKTSFHFSCIIHSVHLPRLFLLLVLKIIKKNRQCTGLFPKVGDHRTRSSHSLLDLSIIIQLCKTAPGSQILAAIDHDNRNLSLGAKGTDEFLIFFIFTIFGETAETGGATVKCLGAFVEAFAESIVDEGLLQNLS